MMKSKGVQCEPFYRLFGIFYRTINRDVSVLSQDHAASSRSCSLVISLCTGSFVPHPLFRRGTDWLHIAQGASSQQVKANTCLTWLTASVREANRSVVA